MKKKTNIRTIIRKIVREEVAMAINEVITELKQPSLSSSPQVSQQKPKKKIVEKKEYSNNSVINDILNETAQDEEWKTLGGGVQTTQQMNDVLQSSYGDMMNGGSSPTPGVVIDGVTGDVPGMDFLKKDYRKLMKKTEEKVKQSRG